MQAGVFLFWGERMRDAEYRISDCISDCSRDCAGAYYRNWTKDCPLRSLPQNWDDIVLFFMKISIFVLCKTPYRFLKPFVLSGSQKREQPNLF